MAPIAKSAVNATAAGDRLEQWVTRAHQDHDERRGAFAERERGRHDRQEVQVHERTAHAACEREHGGKKRSIARISIVSFSADLRFASGRA